MFAVEFSAEVPSVMEIFTAPGDYPLTAPGVACEEKDTFGSAAPANGTPPP